MGRLRYAWTLVLAVGALWALSLPAPAMGWGNGRGNANGFGGHDWVLYHSNRVARAKGVKWLDYRVAQLKTDDPDTVLKDWKHHVYDVSGSNKRGDAPSRISALYVDAVYKLRYGDKRGASVALGLLSHYAADIRQPLHTDETLAHRGLHLSYEGAVDARFTKPSVNKAWFRFDGLNYTSNLASREKSSARVAHRDFRGLLRKYSHGGYRAASPITKKALGGAANDLTDIIFSVHHATRVKAGKLEASINDATPPEDAKLRARTRLFDRYGRPIPGVRMTFRWQIPGGVVKKTARTSASGVASSTLVVHGMQPGHTYAVKASCSAGGVRRSARLAFTAH